MVSILGRRCALIFGAAACMLFLGFPPVAGAEGRCPPGQYPIGGQGVGGCAPIPGGDAGSGQTGPIQTGRWNKTWGAIAMASNGDVGVSVGKVRKADASNEALANCSQHGASDCKVTQTYRISASRWSLPELAHSAVPRLDALNLSLPRLHWRWGFALSAAVKVVR